MLAGLYPNHFISSIIEFTKLLSSVIGFVSSNLKLQGLLYFFANS
jgi:hypothetical protein